MRSFLMFAAFLFVLPAWAEKLDIQYGVNHFDINGDGVADIIVRTRWDVYSAHSSDQYHIAVASSGDGRGIPEGYYNVALEDDNKTITLGTSEGADCILSGYVFNLNKHKVLEITYYHRDFGAGYADSQPVTVTTYRLDSRQNRDFEGIGYTPFYLKKIHETKTLKTYCDVQPLMK